MNSEGERAVTKETLGERGLHLLATARAASDLCAVLLEDQKRGVVLRGTARPWDLEAALPAAANTLLRVRCDGSAKENEREHTLRECHSMGPLLQQRRPQSHG
jgi:hypothetical protein